MNNRRLLEQMNEQHPLNQESDRLLQELQPPLKDIGEKELHVVRLARWAVENLPLYDNWTPTLEELLLEVRSWTPKQQMNYFLRERGTNEPTFLLHTLRQSKSPRQGALQVVEQLQYNLMNEPLGDLASPNALLRD